MPLKPPFVWRSQKVLRFPVETSSIATCSKARHFCGSVGNYCFWTMAADCFPKHLPSCRCLLFLDVSGSFSLILRRISTRCLLFASILIYILELNAAQAGIMFCFHSASQDFVDLLYIDSRAPARIASHVFFMRKVNRWFYCGLFNSEWKKHKDDGSCPSFSYQILSLTFESWLCSQSTLWPFRAVRLQLEKTLFDSQGMSWLISEKHARATFLRSEFSISRLTLT